MLNEYVKDIGEYCRHIDFKALSLDRKNRDIGSRVRILVLENLLKQKAYNGFFFKSFNLIYL